LGIRESLIKYVFEPAGRDKEHVKQSVRAMRDRARTECGP
jgi:hypothetical protein